MVNRKYLTAIFLCVAFAGMSIISVSDISEAASGAPSSANPIIIQVGYENAPGELIDRACQEWQKNLSDISAGTMQIQLFPSSQLGSKDELLDQMIAGSNVVTLVNGGIFADRGVGDFGIVFSPYLFSSWEDVEKLTASDWWNEQCSTAEGRHLKILAPWHYGSRHTLTKRPVKSPADLKGLKIRVPNNTYQVKGIQAVGATPTPMPLTEVYTALQQGVIDGLENPLTTLEGGAFYEVASYLILDGHIYDETMWTCGTDFFNSLSSEQQNWLIESAKKAGLYNNNELEASNQAALERMVSNGVQVVDFNFSEFQTAAAPYYEDPELLAGWSQGLVEKVKTILGK
ncbi:MAG: C4-dicarboxylate TRAP transporter substrate-binding protein [Holosporales bacterium]|nr:C4-dicarboxylate TRAP transporter substrate-binding protein [Holosporales bacterium]